MSKKEKNLKIFSKNRNGYTPRKSTERTVANYHLTHTGNSEASFVVQIFFRRPMLDDDTINDMISLFTEVQSRN